MTDPPGAEVTVESTLSPDGSDQGWLEKLREVSRFERAERAGLSRG